MTAVVTSNLICLIGYSGLLPLCAGIQVLSKSRLFDVCHPFQDWWNKNSHKTKLWSFMRNEGRVWMLSYPLTLKSLDLIQQPWLPCQNESLTLIRQHDVPDEQLSEVYGTISCLEFWISVWIRMNCWSSDVVHRFCWTWTSCNWSPWLADESQFHQAILRRQESIALLNTPLDHQDAPMVCSANEIYPLLRRMAW